MLSSSVLIGLTLSGCGVGALLVVFVYFVSSSFILLYFPVFSEMDELFSGIPSFFWFSFADLTISIIYFFYKILVSSCIFSSGLFLLFCSVAYSFFWAVLFVFVSYWVVQS